LAKWLQLRPTLLLLDEPTQGVDVGARETIWNELNKLTKEGSSIIVASTDYDQLAQICDRILVFNSGIIVEEMTGGAFSKSEIAECVYIVASQSQKGE
jgi:ribose transport system ATP-binding protein